MSSSTGRRCSARPHSRHAQQAIVAGAIAVVLAGTLVTVPSLLADSAVSEASRSWRTDPAGALDRLERARALNPLAARPWQVEGQIQASRNRPKAARAAFAQAARKQPDAWFPYFAQGLLTDATGDRAAARRLLTQARARNPREPLVTDALRRLDTAPMTFDEAVQRIDERRDVRRNIE